MCYAGGSQSPDSPEGQAEGVSPPALQRPENLCCAGGSQSPDSPGSQAEGVKPPAFQTGPRTYREEVGSTALLLCKVNNLGNFLYIIKYILYTAVWPLQLLQGNIINFAASTFC
jgi:hypothetical protein